MIDQTVTGLVDYLGTSRANTLDIVMCGSMGALLCETNDEHEAMKRIFTNLQTFCEENGIEIHMLSKGEPVH